MPDSFKIHKNKNGLCYFSIPRFDNTGLVKTCFTSRNKGVSEGNYSSLNMGMKTQDKKENVLENFRIMCKTLDIPLDSLVHADQVHGDRIRTITKVDCSKGIAKISDFSEVDGLVTSVPNIGLVTVYADCVPIYLLDPKQKIIALVHAGWRGTELRIAAKAVKTMMSEFKSRPEDCLAAIGPSIGSCCYEVDKAVMDKFSQSFADIDEFSSYKGNNKYMLDLWKANKVVLKEIGILDRNIITSGLCTMCGQDTFFSYRRDHGLTGRMAAIMMLI